MPADPTVRVLIVECGAEHKGACCPRCGWRFSDWFRWGENRYCWPCHAGEAPAPFPTWGYIRARVRQLLGRLTGRPFTIETTTTTETDVTEDRPDAE